MRARPEVCAGRAGRRERSSRSLVQAPSTPARFIPGAAGEGRRRTAPLRACGRPRAEQPGPQGDERATRGVARPRTRRDEVQAGVHPVKTVTRRSPAGHDKGGSASGHERAQGNGARSERPGSRRSASRAGARRTCRVWERCAPSTSETRLAPMDAERRTSPAGASRRGPRRRTWRGAANGRLARGRRAVDTLVPRPLFMYPRLRRATNGRRRRLPRRASRRQQRRTRRPALPRTRAPAKSASRRCRRRMAGGHRSPVQSSRAGPLMGTRRPVPSLRPTCRAHRKQRRNQSTPFRAYPYPGMGPGSRRRGPSTICSPVGSWSRPRRRRRAARHPRAPPGAASCR